MSLQKTNTPQIIKTFYLIFIVFFFGWVVISTANDSLDLTYIIAPIIIAFVTGFVLYNKRFELTAIVITLIFGAIGWVWDTATQIGCVDAGAICSNPITTVTHMHVVFTIVSLSLILLRNYKKI
jgi:hypothetical protein